MIRNFNFRVSPKENPPQSEKGTNIAQKRKISSRITWRGICLKTFKMEETRLKCTQKKEFVYKFVETEESQKFIQ